MAGAGLLYVPAYSDLATFNAHTEAAAQTPVCIAIWVWLLWHERARFLIPAEPAASSPAGWIMIGVAAVMYALGRSQVFYQLQIGSQVPFFVGTVWVLLGRRALQALWFLPVFLFLLIPVPGSLVNGVLVPLKKIVSTLVANGLYLFGLPIARDGVVLYIGRYQLLIADACSGLNSMIALTAIGCLYVYLSRYKGWLANAILLGAVLPIAFIANIVRVTGLVLTTYLWGEVAGQQFHDFAAFAEIVVAIGGFFLVDRLVQRWRGGVAVRAGAGP